MDMALWDPLSPIPMEKYKVVRFEDHTWHHAYSMPPNTKPFSIPYTADVVLVCYKLDPI